MPTYEYRCTACRHEFEKFQRMSDEPRAECPACGQESERRLSAGAGLIFKGSGFYITDYRSESYKKAAGNEAPASSPPAGSEAAGSSKSEASTSASKGE